MVLLRHPLQRCRIMQITPLLFLGHAAAVSQAAPLPGSIAELRSLCGEAGLVGACAMLSDMECGDAEPHYAASLLQRKNWVHNFVSNTTMPEGGCASPGALVFAHIMKAGGMAVDEFLACRCLQGACAIQIHEVPMHPTLGFEGCEPSVCSFHGSLSGTPSTCGGAFTASKRFTVLRNPVDRVWSFYNYFGRWFQPFRKRTLESILESWGEDLNAGIPVAKEKCEHCRQQLSNLMVTKTFCATCGSLSHRVPSRQEVAAALEEAKQTLRGMDAIFITEDLSKLPELFDSVPDLFPGRVGVDMGQASDQCQMQQRNHQSYKKDAPSARATQLMRELNWADIELYEYALTLPNLRRPPAIGP